MWIFLRKKCNFLCSDAHEYKCNKYKDSDFGNLVKNLGIGLRGGEKVLSSRIFKFNIAGQTPPCPFPRRSDVFDCHLVHSGHILLRQVICVHVIYRSSTRTRPLSMYSYHEYVKQNRSNIDSLSSPSSSSTS